MKMPFAERAIVSPNKLKNYLLSPTHMLGRYKARFFFKLGYSLSNAQRLSEDLIRIAQTYPVVSQTTTPFGTKFVIDGKLLTPIGISVKIRTVWFINADEKTPRLVTAYPLK